MERIMAPISDEKEGGIGNNGSGGGGSGGSGGNGGSSGGGSFNNSGTGSAIITPMGFWPPFLMPPQAKAAKRLLRH
jgi:hypothetical protein